MRQGFRTPPATHYWKIPLELDDQRMQDLAEMMASDLAEQRLRYDAAHAGD
jgi:hypothetical protein